MVEGVLAKLFPKRLSARFAQKYQPLGSTEPEEESRECELKVIEQEKEVTVLLPKDACKCHKEDLAKALNVDLQTGLSEFSVLQRRLKHGWNEFSVDATEPIWKKYLDQMMGE